MLYAGSLFTLFPRNDSILIQQKFNNLVNDFNSEVEIYFTNILVADSVLSTAADI